MVEVDRLTNTDTDRNDGLKGGGGRDIEVTFRNRQRNEGCKTEIDRRTRGETEIDAPTTKWALMNRKGWTEGSQIECGIERGGTAGLAGIDVPEGTNRYSCRYRKTENRQIDKDEHKDKKKCRQKDIYTQDDSWIFIQSERVRQKRRNSTG